MKCLQLSDNPTRDNTRQVTLQFRLDSELYP